MLGVKENEQLFKCRGVVEFRLYLDLHIDWLTEKTILRNLIPPVVTQLPDYMKLYSRKF
jgi:hypothetical protein